MLRKLLIFSCLLAAVFVTTAYIANADSRKKKKEKTTTTTTDTAKASAPVVNYRELGSPLPPLNLIMMDSSVITNKDVKNNANLFVMIFNPTCGHCEAQTETFKSNISLFKKTKLLLVATPMMKPYLPTFNANHKMSDFPTIQYGIDSATSARLFIYQSLPQINIYDKDRKLIKIFSGNVVIDSLKEYIQ
jgi:hypothetical protein